MNIELNELCECRNAVKKLVEDGGLWGVSLGQLETLMDMEESIRTKLETFEDNHILSI